MKRDDGKEKDFDISLLKITNFNHHNSLPHEAQYFPKEHNISLTFFIENNQTKFCLQRYLQEMQSYKVYIFNLS